MHFLKVLAAERPQPRTRFAAVFALLLTGCATVPGPADYRATRALLPPPAEGVEADARARFREIFCAVADTREPSSNAAGADCEEPLWRLADEPAGEHATPALAALDPRLNVFVVGGAFSDCFGEASIAYREAIRDLAAAGHRVRTIPIGSRSGSAHNARMIADALRGAGPEPEDLVLLLGYSKGSVDILEFLVEFPQLAARVDAVLSIAGPVNGSLLAARGAWAYDTLLAHAFAGRCDPGDGGVVDSLLPERRLEWLRSHPLPAHLRYYVLSAFTVREHIARGLLPAWQILASTDPRNDGQVTLEEALIPGATLLGYANADHWGVAIDIERELSFVAGRPDGMAYPRDILFEAMLRFVGEDLAHGEPGSADRTPQPGERGAPGAAAGAVGGSAP